MAVSNRDVARMLDEHADALAKTGANVYKVRAYRKAARTIEGMDASVAKLVAEGHDLRRIEGVGETLALTITEIVTSGHDSAPRAVVGDDPAGDLARIPGIGPTRAKALVEAGITDLQALATALAGRKLAALPGFGEKVQEALLESLAAPPAAERQIRPLIVPVVEALRATLAAAKGVTKVEAAGSFRRKRDTVGDVDFVAAGKHDAAAKALEAHREAARVLGSGDTKTSVQLRSGLQVDLRTVDAKSHGAALLYFTGSKEHNVTLRGLAKQKGLKLNEYGLYKGTKQVAGATEESIYKALGLPFIPPELREDRGEVQAAAKGKLPTLVTLDDLKGDLHTHTDWTDGSSTLEAMAKAAQKRGLRYMAVTDHTPRTAIAGGMPWARFLQQHKHIDRLNKSYEEAGAKFRLLKGAEVDILKDGKLDLPAKALAELDVVVASLHFREQHPPKELTERALKAMATGQAHILGHPSSRMLGKRPAIEHDWTRLIDAAADQGWALEVDGQPWRQDIWDTLVRQCKDAGVKVSVDSDAHSTGELGYIEWALDQARRGWMEKADVLNTRTADELLKLLA